MKNYIKILTIFIVFPFGESSIALVGNVIEMVPNIVVIKFKDDHHLEINKIQTGNIKLNNLLAQHAITSLHPVIKKNDRLAKSTSTLNTLSNIYYADFFGDQSPLEVAANLETSPNIEYAEPKYIYYINAVPNDSLYHQQKVYYDIIKAPQAWDVVKGEDGAAIIAIVDGGTDISHPDLTDNIWANDVEINGTEGVDDDGNGFIDDLYGWNFATKSGDPTGLESTPGNADHGTLTAGIVSATSNNLTGVAGVSWNATVMAINVGSKSNDRAISYGTEGIIYAAENGADIISCSWGGYNVYSRYVEDVIEYANSMGAIVIAAAGNDNTDEPFYPSSYEDVISVAGTDTNDNQSNFSNYGQHIDLSAPAESIYGPLSNGRYGVASGTSLSAPLVAGVAGLVKAKNPEWTGRQAGEQVRVNTDSMPAHTGEFGRGRLNAYRALTESSPSIHYVEYDFIDENDNGVIEPGERIEMYITLINYLSTANSVNITLSTSTNCITIINEIVSLSSIGMLEKIRLSDPFVFDVAENTPGNPLIKFEIQIEADNYTDRDRFNFERISPLIIWDKYANNPILSGNVNGTWNRQVFWPSVLYNEELVRYEMWFSASEAPDGPFLEFDWQPMRVGYATSNDGINWTKHPDPVLEPEVGTWDESTAEGVVVIRENGQYKMWYIGWSPSNEIGGIGYATSQDGISWTKYPGNPVMVASTAAWQAGGILKCHVLPVQEGYKMWYSGRNTKGSKTHIGYATSVDGINWISDSYNNPVLATGKSGRWDDLVIDSPHVLFINNVYHMWYAGRRSLNPPWQTGWATSDDGIHWNKYNNTNTISSLYSDSDPVLRAGSAQWDADFIMPGTVIHEGDSLRMWYSACRSPALSYSWRIGYATMPINPGITDARIDKDVSNFPEEYLLSQNYPNPFNPTTTITYNLPAAGRVDLSVYNVLVSQKQSAGTYSAKWDAARLASGIYFYKLQSNGFVQTKKMFLLR
jgi:subtilisin family serine protease/predicted GH43/DUF377 family glycosyl hydrolase